MIKQKRRTITTQLYDESNSFLIYTRQLNAQSHSSYSTYRFYYFPRSQSKELTECSIKIANRLAVKAVLY